MDKVKFFTRFDPPPSPSLKCEDASLTRQEFVPESDINNIMKRYAAGVPLPSGSRQPIFDDFSNISPGDYQAALDRVKAAQEHFDALPSAVRDKFRNDPYALIDYLSNPQNHDEAVKLGLIKAPEPSTVVSVPPAKTEGGSNEPPPTTTT